MKRFLFLIALALVAGIVQYSRPSTAQADTIPSTLITLITSVQTDAGAEITDQPVVKTSWGNVKRIYGPPSKTDAQAQDSPSAARMTKPGAEMMASQTQMNWWRNIGQNGRNSAIVNQALRYNGHGGYYNCKEWVRMVVSQASQTVVQLPQTLPDASGWYLGYSQYLIGMSGGISNVHTGSIIQMRYPTKYGITPHTMIVHSVGSGGFWVVEANWIPGTVGMRWVSTSDFLSKVIAYSTYTVTG